VVLESECWRETVTGRPVLVDEPEIEMYKLRSTLTEPGPMSSRHHSTLVLLRDQGRQRVVVIVTSVGVQGQQRRERGGLYRNIIGGLQLERERERRVSLLPLKKKLRLRGGYLRCRRFGWESCSTATQRSRRRRLWKQEEEVRSRHSLSRGGWYLHCVV
jgi:hypothetical protein